MRGQLTYRCDQHPAPHDCPDVFVIYNARFDEYGMPVRDGGWSSVLMRFCPWCGTAMPDSKRDFWFETLATMGINNPSKQTVPDLYRSDAWWRSLCGPGVH